MRKLKLWNGRAVCYPGIRNAHFYVAAYSVADLRSLFVEVGLFDPGQSEVKNYWAAGCWGTRMAGITPERGVWVSSNEGRAMPRRILPPSKQ
jgi:hypothetical protein